MHFQYRVTNKQIIDVQHTSDVIKFISIMFYIYMNFCVREYAISVSKDSYREITEYNFFYY